MKTSRRNFIATTAAAGAALTLPGFNPLSKDLLSIDNKLPVWRGFNLLDFFNPQPQAATDRNKTTADDLKWIAGWGFNFIRIPLAYPRYLNFDRSRDIKAEETISFDARVLEEIDRLVYMANNEGLHVSLNLHRAPGYCINAGFHEPFNLWKDKAAREAFCSHWAMWAERYASLSNEKISFDLLNEPAYIEDMNDQFATKGSVPGQIYYEVAAAAAAAIRKYKADRLIIADGNSGGNNVIPELEPLGLAQSCRGYWPGAISHYQAPWVWKDPSKAPLPVWPGTIDGKYYGREKLEEFYKPWLDLKNRGTGVHCGECGCWKNTPHKVFLAWFGDVTDILLSNDIGFALWNFRGDFGILDSGRADIEYSDWYGHKLDARLLALITRSL